jgi:serine protease Do
MSKKYNDMFEKRPELSFFKNNIIIPFIAGVLGTTLVIATVYNVPSIHDQLFPVATSTTEADDIPLSSRILTDVNIEDYSKTSISVAEKLLPSIVGITVEFSVSGISRYTGTTAAEGSGIVISDDGYILTNNHIVSNDTASNSSFYQVSSASKISVYFYGDETPYDAEIVGTDEQTDLAVIKVNKESVTPAKLGDSDDVSVGEWVMAIGSPLGFKSSVSSGIVSAINRTVTDSDGKKYILTQTDAAINSGNSGGALVNSKGEVIGVNTLKISGAGIENVGFAIPINNTKDIYAQLIEFNKVKRPYLGIKGTDVSEKDSQTHNVPVGVYVNEVTNFGPAQKAEIKVGDVITKINGVEVKSMEELNNEKNKKAIGDEVTLTIKRNEDEMDIKVKLEETP